MSALGLALISLYSSSTLSSRRSQPTCPSPCPSTSSSGNFSHLKWTPPTPPTRYCHRQPAPPRKLSTLRHISKVSAAPLMIKSLITKASGKAKGLMKKPRILHRRQRPSTGWLSHSCRFDGYVQLEDNDAGHHELHELMLLSCQTQTA